MKGVMGLMGAASLFAASTARADIPPPDTCRTEHAVCNNAGETYDKAGVCTAATCTKGSASGQTTTYECLKCEPADVAGAAGASTTDTEADPHKDESGCSVGTLGTEKGIATLMLGFGLVALGISRRRR